jgi:hypothetical protein
MLSIAVKIKKKYEKTPEMLPNFFKYLQQENLF